MSPVMHRRTLLQLLAGVAAAGVPSFASQSPRRDRIVIAGAGILGANLAYRLARRGAAVTVVERMKPAAGATAVMIASAEKEGARVEYPCEITGLDLQGGRLRAVRTTKGDLEADVLVIACGVDTPRIAAMAGLTVPLTRSPGILVHTAPS